jgi:hypothetical protein
MQAKRAKVIAGRVKSPVVAVGAGAGSGAGAATKQARAAQKAAAKHAAAAAAPATLLVGEEKVMVDPPSLQRLLRLRLRLRRPR